MRPKTKTILFILLSFILGWLCGWFVEDHSFVKAVRTPSDFQKMLAERLHLNSGQIAQVDSILDTRKQQMDSQRKRILAMRDTIQMEIRRILSAEQVNSFDTIIQEINVREAKKHEH
jgi:hypothetical protein